MNDSRPPVSEHAARLAAADVIFVTQDGYRQASARVRCYNFASALQAQGIRAEVLSFYDHLGASDQGGPVSSIPEEEKIRLNLEAYHLLAGNPRAVLYLQKTTYPALAVALAAARNGNRIILDYDDYEVDASPFRRLEAWIPGLEAGRWLAEIARQADACVAASHKIIDLLTPFNPDVRLVHTVADQTTFHHQGRDRPRRRLGDFVNIGYSGDFWGDIPMKDVLFALDAFAMIPRAARCQARFHVIGFGRAWETLKNRIRERFADVSQIVLHEFVPPAEMPDLLKEMDIGVLPYSDNEFNAAKSPTKMFEYLLAQVTVLATPVGEAIHCVSHEKTALIADGMEAYSDAMHRLIVDHGLRRRLAENACAEAMTRYSLQGAGRCLAGLVREIAGRGSRGGRVPDDAPQTATLEGFLRHRLGRLLAPPPRELFLLRRDLRVVLAAADFATVNPRRWTGPLIAALDWPGLPGAEGVAPERVSVVRTAAAQRRNAAALRSGLCFAAPPRPAGAPSVCKLAAAEDWEDPRWRGWLLRVRNNVSTFNALYADASDAVQLAGEDFRNGSDNFFKRSRGAWERTQLLYALERMGVLAGAADPRSRVLALNVDVDGLHLLLSEVADQTVALDVGCKAAECAARVAAGGRDPWLAKPRRFRGDHLTIFHAPLEDVPVPPDGTWDAAVLPQGALLRCAAPDAVAQWIDARLKPGGVIALTAEVRLNDGTDIPGLPAAAAQGGGFAALIERCAGWSSAQAFDASLSDATLDRFAVTGTPDARNPHFVLRTGDTLHLTSVWTFVKTAEGKAIGGLEEALRGLGALVPANGRW